MTKKELITILNYAKYAMFVAATVCILVFQFIAEPICITVALSLYVVAFGLMFASSLIHCIEIYQADGYVKKTSAKVQNVEDSTIETKENVEEVNLKSEKVWSVLGSIFFALFTIFTLVVLILF